MAIESQTVLTAYDDVSSSQCNRLLKPKLIRIIINVNFISCVYLANSNIIIDGKRDIAFFSRNENEQTLALLMQIFVFVQNRMSMNSNFFLII